MTLKQEMIYELNLHRAALDWPLVSEKKAQKMSIGVVMENLELAKQSLSGKSK